MAGLLSFSVGGTTYDLSSLQGQVAEGKDKKVSTYEYKAAVCSNMDDQCQDIMTGKTLSGAVYQYGGGSSPGSKQVCWDVLAFWDESNVQAEALDTSTDGVPAGATGVALKFSNGDECRNAPRKTTMNMICDGSAGTPGTLEGFQDETDSCHFIINWSTKGACPGGHGGSGSSASSGGMSGGWIFIILLICCSFVYFAGFFLYSGYQTKEWTSKENCPHTGFWTQVPGWVKTGCMVSFDYTKSGTMWLVSKCKKDDSEAADGDEETEY